MFLIERIVLELIFTDGYGNFKITLVDPKDGLTGTQVEEAMQDIISYNIFATKNGNLVSPVAAQIVSRTVSEIEI